MSRLGQLEFFEDVDWSFVDAGSEVYDPALTMVDDYSDAYAPPQYGDSGFDPATGVGVGETAWQGDWDAWEAQAARELEATTGGNVQTAVASFTASSPGIDWQGWYQKGVDIYKLFQSTQQPIDPRTGKPYPPALVMIDPATGKPVPAVRDPRTGQLVPAVRDPRTGQLVPQQAGLFGGGAANINNWLIVGGASLVAYFLLTRR